MPILDGIDATARNRRSDPEARIVLVTVHSESVLVERGLAARASGYVLKEAAGDELVAAIQAALDPKVPSILLLGGVADFARRREYAERLRASSIPALLIDEALVAFTAARRATRFEALEPLRQGVRACFGAFAEGVAGGLKLRHDHGSQFVAHDYQAELAFLGIASSPAFVREPEGNGCVERFIRTLKENLLWVRRFATIEDLLLALHVFKDTYNRTWIVERHGYQTPAAVRAAQLAPLPAAA